MKNDDAGDGLPSIGYLRLKQIIGDKNAVPPIPPLIPVSKSSWWAGVGSGKYPKAILIGIRTVAWSVEDIRLLIKTLKQK